MSRQKANELLVAIVAAVCTAVMAILLWQFGTRSDYWGVIVPALFVVFYISWRSATNAKESSSAVPYSILMVLISALVLILDLRF
jgi:hypothetical protein